MALSPSQGPGLEPSQGTSPQLKAASISMASAEEASSPPEVWTDLGLLLLAVIWGLNFIVVKVALELLHPLAFNALRFPLACITLLILVRLRGTVVVPERRHVVPLIFWGLLGNVAYQLFFIFGLNRTGAGNAGVLLATTPVWTILLSAALGHERPTLAVWLGAGLTLMGMLLVMLGAGALKMGGGALWGDLLLIGGAMTWAVYTVGARNLVVQYGSIQVTAWTLWIGTAVLVPLGIPALVAAPPFQLPAVAWGGIAYAGILAVGIAYALWNGGVRRLGNTRTAIYSNMVPVVALTAAWFWLDEVPTTLQLSGAGLILGGILLARLKRKVSSAPEAPEIHIAAHPLR